MNVVGTEVSNAPAKLQSADLSLTTALIVEDQPQILSLFSDCLKILRVGQVMPVNSASAAQNLITNIQNNPAQVGVSHIDFAIIDWNLLGNSFVVDDNAEQNQGPDVCRWLRQVEFARFMPVLGMSSYSNKDIIKDMINGGVNGYLSKPFTIHDLSRQIQRIVQDIKPYVVTPSGYFGPDRRRVRINVEPDLRRSQNGVRSFNPPRSLRAKTAGSVEIPETDVSKVMQLMREIAPPDYRTMVGINLEQIRNLLQETPTDVSDPKDAAIAKQNFAEVNLICNDILGNPGGFTYQMVAETMASMSRFVSDKHFISTPQAHSMVLQQLATAEVVVQRDMKGPARGDMRKLFSESLAVIEKVLKKNQQVNLRLNKKS